MDKSPEAFRTISEVAEALDTPAHVLRFWESRFPQIRPVKRAGGRRYYRPADVALLTGIKHLLHDEGMTIRGVQKILREQGVRHVAALAGLDAAEIAGFDAEDDIEAALAAQFGTEDDTQITPVAAETAQVVALETALMRHSRVVPRAQSGADRPLLPDRPAAAPSAAVPTLLPVKSDPPATDFSPLWDIPMGASAAQTLRPKALTPAPQPDVPQPDVPQPDVPQPDVAAQLSPDAPSDLLRPAGGAVDSHTIATRLRALSGPLSGPNRAGLAALRARLHALHTRIAAAQHVAR